MCDGISWCRADGRDMEGWFEAGSKREMLSADPWSTKNGGLEVDSVVPFVPGDVEEIGG